MKQGSTLFLKGAVWAIGLVVLAICVFALPRGIIADETGYYRPILAGLYVAAIPFFFALYQALKLLSYIDRNTAFSNLSILALKKIKYCAAFIALLFTAGAPFIHMAADYDDAPGVNVIGMVIIFASVVISVFAALLQELLQRVIAIKAENDLTV